MKCAIIYFSSTGITPRYAIDIAKGFSQKESVQFEFLRLKKGISYDLTQYDFFGIGAPSYSFRAPRLATRLLRKMNFHKKPYFLFCTFNSIAGNVLWNLYRAVKHSAGLCLGFTQQGVAVNIRAWKPKTNSPKQLKGISEEALEKAEQFGVLISNRYKEILNEKEAKQRKEWIPSKRIILIIWALFLTWSCEMLLTVGFKHVNKKKCTKCGLCASKICPSGSIKLSKDKIPRFAEIYCVGCNGCVNLCPEDAIWTFQTRNKKQYNLYKDYILKKIKLKNK